MIEIEGGEKNQGENNQTVHHIFNNFYFDKYFSNKCE